MSAREIRRYYQTADRIERYGPGDARRQRELARLCRSERRYLGRRVLDLACGGGVLGFLLEPSGRVYVGVDINPDMIRMARATAKARGSRCRFLVGDAVHHSVPGRFDTLTLLGNALGHLRVDELARLLVTRRANVHRGSYLLVDYRDVVAMFYRGEWRSPFVEVHKGGRTVHRTRRVDTGAGVIHLRAGQGRKWTVTFTQKIWSPFIVRAILADHGWALVRRRRARAWRGCWDVYRFQGP